MQRAFTQFTVLGEADDHHHHHPKSSVREALPVLHVSEIAERQAEIFLARLWCLLCCPDREADLQAGAAPAPTCCPAAWSWISTHVKGFSWVCGSGVQKLLFPVNGSKPLMKACCCSHTWKQISSEAAAHLSPSLEASDHSNSDWQMKSL